MWAFDHKNLYKKYVMEDSVLSDAELLAILYDEIVRLILDQNTMCRCLRLSNLDLFQNSEYFHMEILEGLVLVDNESFGQKDYKQFV